MKSQPVGQINQGVLAGFNHDGYATKTVRRFPLKKSAEIPPKTPKTL